jgi:hypothetical protein
MKEIKQQISDCKHKSHLPQNVTVKVTDRDHVLRHLPEFLIHAFLNLLFNLRFMQRRRIKRDMEQNQIHKTKPFAVDPNTTKWAFVLRK